MSFDWKSLVRKIAPTIGAALGGPLGGIAMQTVSQAVLGKPDASEEELSKALASATPETLLAIKKADNDFKVRMKELDVDVTRMEFDDVKDARARERELRDKMPAVLAIMLLLMFGAALVALFLAAIPENNKATIYTMIGSLGTLTITACGYYHGSSRGSAKKDLMRLSSK